MIDPQTPVAHVEEFIVLETEIGGKSKAVVYAWRSRRCPIDELKVAAGDAAHVGVGTLAVVGWSETLADGD